MTDRSLEERIRIRFLMEVGHSVEDDMVDMTDGARIAVLEAEDSRPAGRFKLTRPNERILPALELVADPDAMRAVAEEEDQ